MRSSRAAALLALLLAVLCARPADAAIAFSQGVSNHISTCATTNNATPTITQPAAGSLIILWIFTSTTGSITRPAAFTAKKATTNSFLLDESYLIATGSGETSWTYADSLATGFCDSLMVVVTGENQATPYDVNNTNSTTLTGSSGPFTTNAVAPSISGDLPIVALNTGTSGMTISTKSPTTLTNQANANGGFFLLYDNVYNSTSAYTGSMTMTGTNSFAHQIETLDMIAPAVAKGGILRQGVGML